MAYLLGLERDSEAVSACLKATADPRLGACEDCQESKLTQGGNGEGLRLAACEQGAAMRARQDTGPRGDATDTIKAAAIRPPSVLPRILPQHI